jgi:23S rRNA (uracil-5-)-methyltransferase RumA
MSRRPKKKKQDFFDTVDTSGFVLQTPVCEHFSVCGGCRFQHIVYADQLYLKEAYLQSLFAQDIAVQSAPDAFAYRNRMDFVYAFGELGLRKRGDYTQVVGINRCHLMPDFAHDLFTRVKELLKTYRVASYDFLAHTGFLRYVTFRYAPSTKESMIIFTSTSPSPEQEQVLQSVIGALKEEVTSIYWFLNDTITDVSIPLTAAHKHYGKESITEHIGQISLRYGPQSFFQVNVAVANRMFEEIARHVSGNTIDVCCGVGAIALFVADKASTCMGIEEVSQAVQFAQENAKHNKKKTLFFCADMKAFAEYAPLDIDTLILDPPRAGIGKKVALRIRAAQPQKIIYMSCNPKTQKEDIAHFLADYEQVFFQGYDMFPQTNHVETLLVLKRK